ncbi:uncharacterized protein N7446_003937 [Penicillium canescens]|uniref:uncharacterized protein n=1 Tax=Penicillium canescens TaxID=5083 RepID=UPI0026E07BCA|nr:uncharacterized protein N7446_003937 [Penicillium canescens]KAJ6040745.1 hypothetical protein N7444_009650 [Penicillium canescens]KAJ6066900.1 hypothetical protein N7446_003937 [Penicillium canescens]
MCTETFGDRDQERYLSMSMLTSEFIPPSESTPPPESDTQFASLPGSPQFSLPADTGDYFETLCFIDNLSYYADSNVCQDTLDNFQSDMHPLVSQGPIQWPLSPQMPLIWLGDDNTFNAHIAEATLVCNPADMVLPCSPSPSQAERWADGTAEIFRCRLSAGDNPLSGSYLCRSPHFSNILDTLPQIEPDLDLGPTLTEQNIWKTWDTLKYDCANPTIPDDSILLPHWISSNQIEHSINCPREKLPALPLSQHPYQNLISATGLTEPSEDWESCCLLNDPVPHDIGNIPLGKKQESHYPMTKKASLPGVDDTVRIGQAVQYDCDFIGPYTGEPCKVICSRVYG